MQLRRWYKPALCAATAVVAGALAFQFPEGIGLDGLLYDVMIAQRASIASSDQGPEPVAVIAIDQRSLEAEELLPLPRVLFAPHWAELLDALHGAGARAVGFDVIFAWSAEELKPGLDAPFLEALSRYRDDLVLARSARGAPAAPFFYAVGGGEDKAAIALAEITPDPDGVVRHVSSVIETDQGTWLSLPGALAARMGNTTLGSVILGPRRPLETLPTYALIDVLRCAKQDPWLLQRAFAGKAVLVGTTLPEEDRKLAGDRFIAGMHQASPPAPVLNDGCNLGPLGASDPASSTVPGVHVHAAALHAMLTGDRSQVVSPFVLAALCAAVAAGTAALALSLRMSRALPAAGLVGLGLYAGSSALLFANVWLPIALPTLEGAGSLFVGIVARYLAEDRRRRRVQHAFGHYLAPGVVARLTEGDAELKLGGEAREITIMFADLSGFTALSGKVPPETLMSLTNGYLAHIVRAVEATGGYVDKFIGDAVMAMWGAPADDPDHASHAVAAALDAIERIARARAEDEAAGRPGFSVKVGINSGTAVVGNVGAEDRLNYTAVGEAVNLASRLEGVPGDYGCGIVIGPTTAELVKDQFLLCELDRIRVKGKVEPLTIYWPVAAAADATAAQRASVASYEDGLRLYRSRDFVQASSVWRRSGDPSTERAPAALMAARAEAFVGDGPADDWDGVWTRTTK